MSQIKLKRSLQINFMALGIGIVLGASFKALLFVGLIIFLAGAGIWTWLQMKKDNDL